MIATALSPLTAMDEFANLVRQMTHRPDRDRSGQYFGCSPTDTFRPAVNLYETQSSFIVCMDIAGMDQSDIEVSLEKDSVIVRGRRHSPMPPDGSRAVAVHLMEVDHGTFCRSIEVPSGVDSESIAANYHVGLLWITLPKKR